ncbi:MULTISPECIES: glycerophosphodiester phosphodiesterase [Agrobacterium]|jgi:glycerophosphoryl diester phosphodiesterase|uniref:Glycerophosphoryl diester phosphodiesterase n=1 Tax=Agrobacterium tumefaciens TaxID=358 RepID=A0AAW8LXI2_AGRTU|nr:glycerophosphodiester phosphodiesterase family protein [Agrobacterium tumefaciens]MBP2566570.1 glycerophosphoryl diester phosphodiesterase [Agrobacterium tumefaciens]MDP9856789.1 glycerophosphoryl diester phosphodiesterase [Agrobacterium tumefaciens]MDP9873848.1 glycerophosphoryl diester phosphodiesterase [Agrobacterium tumefaciens]MDP9979105.1 glycerophosphoryl diester phosphodiesterase [Agrobacterium tumefaciens]MDR6703602.1 glycerophosphoryl diester phosphodiesterase [Agrobacterium tumef
MNQPILIERDGHRTWLKWHRARRRASDPVFTGERIIEAMRLGASIEVDLVIHADHGCAVLHDRTLERETTGTGRVHDTSAAALRQLHLRDNGGQPIASKVMLLEDLCALLAHETVHRDALLQLDFKEDLQALTPQVVAGFGASVSPIASSVILSGGDFDAIAMLAGSAPGLRTGYDPCHRGTLAQLKASGNYLGFIEDALATAPDAGMIYLDYAIVLAAEDAGVDIIAPIHAAGRRVDAWTINSVTPQSIEQVERLLRLKVDQITTDDPEGLAEVFSR